MSMNTHLIYTYGKDEKVRTWKKGSLCPLCIPEAVQLLRMMSTAMMVCHHGNTLFGKITMERIELGYDKEVGNITKCHNDVLHCDFV